MKSSALSGGYTQRRWLGDACGRVETFGSLASALRIALALLSATVFVEGSARATANSGPQIVGTFELAAPSVQSFVLHGTLPVPQQTFPRSDGQLPLSVLDSDGTVVPAQIDAVTWYPDAAHDGADVVELTARVHLPAGTSTGTHVQYSIVESLHSSGSFTETSAVQQLLHTPNAVTIRTRDVFGHTYVADLLATTPDSKLLRSGSFREQTRNYSAMLPTTTLLGAPTGALQRMMGVHSYVSSWNGENVVSLDLRVNNGTSGHDPIDHSDDAQDKLYFDQLEIVVPVGWQLIPDLQDKGWGTPVTQGSTVVYPIVKALANGKLNMMPQQAQFERRMVLAQTSSVVVAQSIVTDEWLAFCQPGGASGVPYYSWWNRATSRYFPQRHVLPDFEFMGKNATLNKLKSEFKTDYDFITGGVGKGGYPFYSDQLGWAFPFGTKYGGMTGGSDIYLYDGVLTAWSASNEGYRHSELLERMYTERQPDALYDANGEPTSLEEWVTHGSQFDYIDMNFYLTLLTGPDPFGLTTAPKFQVLAVTALGKQPPYESALLSYAPIDIQHHIRYLRSPKVLTWLGNDALAKDDLMMEAELMRLSYNDLPNSPSGGYVPSGMLFDIKSVATDAGVGFGCGRGEAWTVDAMCAAYSISDAAWRTKVRGWFDAYASLVQKGQSSCNGFLMRMKTSKDFNGQYFVRRSTETSMIDQSLVSMRETVYRGVDPAYQASLDHVLSKELYAMISAPSWSSAMSGPISSIAVAPLSGAPYCGSSPALAPDVDNFLPWCSFAYGFEVTGDPIFLKRAAEMSGANGMGQLLSAQENMHFGNHENRAGLIALAQVIWGP